MILFVPIRLDALLLSTDQFVLDAKADFTRLPSTDKTGDVNGDTAYISEELLTAPFEEQNLYLKAGIHLHWALPDALTKGAQINGKSAFPEVPNRWLVIRRQNNSTDEKRWIVESDYLCADGEGDADANISFPVMPPPINGRPYELIGRAVPFEDWNPNPDGARYLESLTAVGYGEPTFAAFYPNCRSVFGFHDAEFEAETPAGLQYDVCGWYGDPANDCLKKFLDDAASKGLIGDDLIRAMSNEFKWTTLEKTVQFPNETLYYASISIEPNDDAARNTSVSAPNPRVAVGNTGTEALSAYLAQSLVETGVALPENADAQMLKSNIEDQLEAVSIASRLANRQLDTGAKFFEARHEKGFTGVSGGTLWSVVLRSMNSGQTSSADALQASAQMQVTLHEDAAHRLNEANRLQQAFERAQDEIESLRRRIFSDWYKYMLCAYPPSDAADSYPNIDDVKDFIETNGLAPLDEKIGATGNLSLKFDTDGNLTGAIADSRDTLAGQLADALGDLIATVADSNARIDQSVGAAYSLKQVPAARYFQPNEPVVLLAGEAAAPTARHGQDGNLRDDGLLECRILEKDGVESLIRENLDTITDRIAEIKASGENNQAFSVWKNQPWNPFLLEWEARVFPVFAGGNLASESGAYQTDFITGNFTVKENAVDFSTLDGKGAVAESADIYSGASVLTPYANTYLRTQIEAYLKDQLLTDYYAANRILPADQTPGYFAGNVSKILDWYQSVNCGAAENAALCNIVAAYENYLAQADFHVLSQSLGGFNEALLQHKQTLQLPVADPLGFDDYQEFAARVRNAVGESLIGAPQPLSEFNPIRTGALELLRLRLVDTFGQFLDIDCNDAVTTEQLKVAGSAHEMTLPPRITQPARINFRWLSADADDAEMNDHPATSPICGWLLPNNLDGSLMIYDSNGKALGSLDIIDDWQSAPGIEPPLEINDIQNKHLQKTVEYLQGMKADFLKDFIAALDHAAENIEPENFAQHQGMALLMGNPVALVRASVDLELRGLPAVHQGWNVFRQDLNRETRDTNAFENVEFPIRLGEYQQFNDGTIGYWLENDDGDYENEAFYVPQSDHTYNDKIKTHLNDPMTIRQTLDGAPQILTFLLDPRGTIHATSGILPVAAASIPPDQYADALKSIEITFLSTPVLTDRGKLRLPLPAEPGFQWSWLQKNKDGWTEITSPAVIKKQVFSDEFHENAEAIWADLINQNWLQLIDGVDDKATIQPANARKGNPDAAFSVRQIEDILDKAQLGTINPTADFSDRQEILEGWLKFKQLTLF